MPDNLDRTPPAKTAHEPVFRAERNRLTYAEYAVALDPSCIAQTYWEEKVLAGLRVKELSRGVHVDKDGKIKKERLPWVNTDHETTPTGVQATRLENPAYNRRALILADGFFVYKNDVFTQIGEKGGGASILAENTPSSVNFYMSEDSYQFGYLGEFSAQEEIKYAKLARLIGVKSQLPLGYIVLDPDKFKKYMQTIGRGRDNREIDKFAQAGEGERPALLFRALGGHRIEALMTTLASGNKQDLQEIQHYLNTAAFALGNETERKPDDYKGFLNTTELQQMRDFVRNPSKLSKNHWITYAKTLMNLHYRNQFRIASHNRQPGIVYLFPTNKPQDLDLTGRCGDFETQLSKLEMTEKSGVEGLLAHDLQILDTTMQIFTSNFGQLQDVSYGLLEQERTRIRNSYFPYTPFSNH